MLKFTVIGISLISMAGLAFQSAPPLPTTPNPAPQKLSEISLLQAENFKLRTQLTQCKVDLLDRESQIASTNLTAQQSKLEQQFRKELNCKETDKFNWTSLKCEPNEKTPPK